MNAKLMPRTLLIVLLALTFPMASFAYFSVGVSVGFAPPALPLYAQPPCPVPGYLWTPGYWAYSEDAADYYWVPGTWVAPPAAGLLWTPGFWALAAGAYLWNAGYWGPHVGFYGGINYGYGYFGAGFEGGYWRDHDFYYNRAVTNISNVNVTNIYNRTVVNTNYYGNRPSFNGATGVHASPTAAELSAAREPHRGISEPQRLQEAAARTVPTLQASVNHGYPSIAATARPGALQSRDVVPSHYAALASSNVGVRRSGLAMPPAARQPGAREGGAREAAARPFASAQAPALVTRPRTDRPSPQPSMGAGPRYGGGNVQSPRTASPGLRRIDRAPSYPAPAYRPPSYRPPGNPSSARAYPTVARGAGVAPRHLFAVQTSRPAAGSSTGGGVHRR